MEEPMEYELRYRGDLLGIHPSQAAAEAHAQTHHGYGRSTDRVRKPTEVEDPERLTIEPRRPVSVFCNGDLLSTFLSESDAERAIEARIAHVRALRPRFARLLSRASFAVVQGSGPPPAPDP